MCQLAKDHNCKWYIGDYDTCYTYGFEGVALRNRLGYCPVSDLPKKVVQKQKERTGQQKSKKNK